MGCPTTQARRTVLFTLRPFVLSSSVSDRCGRSHWPELGSVNSSLKLLLRAVAVFVLALPFLAVALVLMCFQDRPLVSGSVQLTPQDVEKAKRILDEQDPRKAGPDGLQR